ncbi:hypothetical protein [Clostridium sp. B9]|uniref:hypothetical protein n=1 Tax=Clostridium sp. B9 TaxID=3423224 RepID=UPI003D2ED2E4
MLKKNAKQRVEETLTSLKENKCSLEDALKTVEKSVNKEKIENTLEAVSKACECAQTTLNNYQEQ